MSRVTSVWVEPLQNRKRQAKQLARTASLMDTYGITYDASGVQDVVNKVVTQNRKELESTMADILRSNAFKIDAGVLADLKAAIRACEL
jgi:hypothetical protein